MSYIDQAELEAYLKRDLSTAEEASFPILLSAAEIAIDNYTDTNFNVATEESRYFDGGEQEIYIDPCTEITEVAITNSDESITNTLTDDEYVEEPKNLNVKWSLRMRNARFPYGIRNVKVTAKFSSLDGDEVPADVKLACFKLVSAGIINPNGYKKESIEGYSYEMQSEIEQDDLLSKTLAKYRQVYV
jgi:hypothetical protein